MNHLLHEFSASKASYPWEILVYRHLKRKPFEYLWLLSLLLRLAPRKRMAAGSPCQEKKKMPLSLHNISAAFVCTSFSLQKNGISPWSPARRMFNAPPFPSPSGAPPVTTPAWNRLRRQLSLHFFSLQFGRRVFTQSYDASSPSCLLFFTYCHQEKWIQWFNPQLFVENNICSCIKVMSNLMSSELKYVGFWANCSSKRKVLTLRKQLKVQKLLGIR